MSEKPENWGEFTKPGQHLNDVPETLCYASQLLGTRGPGNDGLIIQGNSTIQIRKE